jgi:hypothetical protein
MTAEPEEKERIQKIAGLLYTAARPLRILRSINWPPEVTEEFFAKGASQLPSVSYSPFDPKPTIEILREARRVFRGGVLEGGAPFTKDVVYLFGLLQVSSAIRAIFAAGRSDCLRLLFCGKLDVADIPALCELAVMGLCRPPRYLPPWASDLRALLALLTYSIFMNQIDMRPVLAVAEKMLENAPIVALALE